MKLQLLAIILLVSAAFSFVQTSALKGTLVDLEKNETVDSATVTLTGEKSFETKSDENGVFQFRNVPAGKYELKIQRDSYEISSREVIVKSNEENLGVIVLAGADENSYRFVQDNIPLMSMSESDINDKSSQNVSGVLSASRDAFISASSES